MDVVINLLKSAIFDCIPPSDAEAILGSPAFINISDAAHSDLMAYCQKDPASRNRKDIIAQSSLPYSAVLHYRLAHGLKSEEINISASTVDLYASLISNRGKLKSGAEVHYDAKIGKRFVLDHGYGTVIGETSIIGDDCYILGNVTLGATGISDNPTRERHPIIGNNVQIGAFSRIFGRIRIGNNVFIGPSCTVIKDIPDGARVINNDYKNQVVTAS